MNDFNSSRTELADLLERRLAIVGTLAESLEAGRLALGRNDAEAIARGAAHQAELCHQWSRLEEQLRTQAAKRRVWACSSEPASSADAARSAELAAEWATLSTRIRYLARVHWSLLRHMQRSLAVWSRVSASCQPTYSPPCALLDRPAPGRPGE